MTLDPAVRDRDDPLAAFRDRFFLQPGVIYLDGNSLGLASQDAEAALLREIEAWKHHAIDGWTAGEQPWFYTGERLGARLAPLVGAQADEVCVTGALTTNLQLLAATFYRPSGRRAAIVATELDFPSDLYALRGILQLNGVSPVDGLRLVRSRDGRTIAEQDVIECLGDGSEVALAWLPSVLYRSGQLLEIRRLTRAAHERGVLIGFDLAHSAGILPHRLHDWGVDFAAWCTYKYLNGGPGAAGALFVHRHHFGTPPVLAGWWGSDKAQQFDLAPDFRPARGAGAFQVSTAPVLGAAALQGSLQILAEAGVDRLRAKSMAQTDYLMALAEQELSPLGFVVGTPREHRRRGGHVALEHPDAVRLSRGLKAQGIVPDFRPPNIIRLAPSPLYSSFREIQLAVFALRDLVTSGEFARYSPERAIVA